MPVLHDFLGNPLTLADAASLEAVNDFSEGFLASEARAVNILRIAERDDSAIIQALCAALHMFAENALARTNASHFLARTRAALSARPVTEREARLITAIAAWVEDDLPLAIALHHEQVRAFPRDLVSVKFGQYHCFNRGDLRGMLAMALPAQAPAYDVPYLHGMVAWGWEETNQFPEAERSARRAIAMRKKEPWAHHALAHVLLTQGRNGDGYLFMRDMAPTWTGLNSFMVTHNWWHQALFCLAMDRLDEALEMFDTQVWGVDKSYSQDQVNAVSLLSRIEMQGGAAWGSRLDTRWADVASHLVKRTQDHVLPFLDLHYLYGLARAGRPEAEALLQNIAGFAAQAADAVWRETALPLARGVLAHAQGQFDLARQYLRPVVHALPQVGGSHAQRDWFARMAA
jgi:hypothetical protein